MIRTYSFLIVLFTGLFPSFVFAQEENQENKFLDHYVGIQVNELVKQILSLSGEDSPEHPYYLNYTINHSKTGWGINSGFGYIIKNTTEGDAINQNKNEITQLSFRIGPEKKFYMGKKMILAVGVDYTIFQNRNISDVRLDQGQNNFVQTTVEEITKSTGYGPRASFSYRLSKWVLVGTELTYYHSSRKVSQKTEILSSFNNVETKEEIEDEFTEKELTFLPPTVLFIILQF
jgi:hypothetical protein